MGHPKHENQFILHDATSIVLVHGPQRLKFRSNLDINPERLISRV